MRHNRVFVFIKYVALPIVFLGWSSLLHAQTSKDFESYCEAASLIYKCPKNFSGYILQYDKKFFHYTSSSKPIYPFVYNVVNRDSSICIGFSPMDIHPKQFSPTVRHDIFPGNTLNKEYNLPIWQKADTINHKINYYSPEKSKKLFNATIAGDYYMYNFENPYEKRFYHCRIVFMHKENVGDAEIYYFYNTGDKEKMRKLIKKAYKMLRFK